MQQSGISDVKESAPWVAGGIIAQQGLSSLICGHKIFYDRNTHRESEIQNSKEYVSYLFHVLIRKYINVEFTNLVPSLSTNDRLIID